MAIQKAIRLIDYIVWDGTNQQEISDAAVAIGYPEPDFTVLGDGSLTFSMGAVTPEIPVNGVIFLGYPWEAYSATAFAEKFQAAEE